jgi:maltose/moltooligosaccharide transporter
VDPDTPPSPAGSPPAVHRVGTLVYTRRALIEVMFWMFWGTFFFQVFQSMPSVTPLLLRWHGAGDTTIALVSGSLTSLVSFFWYPVVGTWSDRHRGPLGRRRPFMLWATPPAALALFLLGIAGPAGRWIHAGLSAVLREAPGADACSVAWIGLFVVVFLFFNAFIVQTFACLIADVIPADVMGKFTGIYRAVGALGSLAFNAFAFGHAQAHTMLLYLAMGVIFTAAFSLGTWRIREGDYPPPPPKAAGGRLGAIREYLRTSFSHPFYVACFGITFFFWASLVPLNFVVFFSTQAGAPGYAPTLGLSLQEFGEVRGLTYIVQLPVFFLVGFLADRFHPIRVSVAGMAMTAASYFCCFFFVNGRSSLLFWWTANQAAIAVFLGGAMALSPRLFPRERYGQFISANLMIGMIGLVVSPPIVGWLLQRIGDYRYAFLFCGVLNALSLATLLLVYSMWRRLGGDEGYSPPDPARGCGAGANA